ncbi:hypothetical protein ACRS9K_38525 [Burkholderia cenocepacia]
MVGVIGEGGRVRGVGALCPGKWKVVRRGRKRKKKTKKPLILAEQRLFTFGGESGMFFRFDKTSFSVNNLAQKGGSVYEKNGRTQCPTFAPNRQPTCKKLQLTQGE